MIIEGDASLDLSQADDAVRVEAAGKVEELGRLFTSFFQAGLDRFRVVDAPVLP